MKRKPLSSEVALELMAGGNSENAEREAVRSFLSLAPEGGQVPARQPYGTGRDEAFIAAWYVGATKSKIPRSKAAWGNLEDAREAIYVGARGGYSTADIAAYLRRNYDV